MARSVHHLLLERYGLMKAARFFDCRNVVVMTLLSAIDLIFKKLFVSNDVATGTSHTNLKQKITLIAGSDYANKFTVGWKLSAFHQAGK